MFIECKFEKSIPANGAGDLVDYIPTRLCRHVFLTVDLERSFEIDIVHEVKKMC